MRLQELLELLKAAYVDVARQELSSQGENSNISRISVMTGVHRRDVTRLVEENPQIKRSTNVISRVLNLWQHDSRFTTKTREPRVLSFEGKENDFVLLVSLVSNDLNPYTVLFELERTGAVEKSERGLRLLSKIAVPEGDVEEGFELLGSDEDDLFKGVSENILSPQEIPNLHLKTEYDNIPLDNIAEIRDWFLREGSLFHERARAYLAKFDRDFQTVISRGTGGNKISGGKVEGRARVALGTFSLTETLIGENDKEKKKQLKTAEKRK